ncbi:MAG: hypothetical protein AAGJ32_07955 [Pseudomonadota bacterium]
MTIEPISEFRIALDQIVFVIGAVMLFVEVVKALFPAACPNR